MTITDLEHKPREDWDFCDLWDELLTALQERDEARATAERFRVSIYAVEERVGEIGRERDEARALLAEAWEWTTPSVYGKLGYVDLRHRVRAALGAKEQPGD